jgi:hypothetical protein
MKVWLLDNQIDQRVHEFCMTADDDDLVAWNISPNVSADVCIKRSGRQGTVSSYHRSKLRYVNCVTRMAQDDVIQLHEKAAQREPGHSIAMTWSPAGLPRRRLPVNAMPSRLARAAVCPRLARIGGADPRWARIPVSEVCQVPGGGSRCVKSGRSRAACPRRP